MAQGHAETFGRDEYVLEPNCQLLEEIPVSQLPAGQLWTPKQAHLLQLSNSLPGLPGIPPTEVASKSFPEI